jgi:hypothetical protein
MNQRSFRFRLGALLALVVSQPAGRLHPPLSRSSLIRLRRNQQAEQVQVGRRAMAIYKQIRYCLIQAQRHST